MPEVFPELDQKKLNDAAARVRIFFRERTYADGAETDATNNGYDEIRLNRDRWFHILVYENKLALLFHELLGLVGAEDSGQYMISTRILTETRFSSKRTYLCEGLNEELGERLKCKMRLRFDPQVHDFTVTGVDCDAGGISGWGEEGAVYSWVNGEYYSTRESCSYPDSSGQRSSCQSTSKPVGEPESYERLVFEQGYKFHFEMFTDDQRLRTVDCVAI
jgi:hypothetical protein